MFFVLSVENMSPDVILYRMVLDVNVSLKKIKEKKIRQEHLILIRLS